MLGKSHICARLRIAAQPHQSQPPVATQTRHKARFHLVVINHHHHHQITKLSHGINAIGPAPHRSGRKRELRSIVFATITHIPSLHKIRRNAPGGHRYA
jgi:hypothetical protein